MNIALPVSLSAADVTPGQRRAAPLGSSGAPSSLPQAEALPQTELNPAPPPSAETARPLAEKANAYLHNTQTHLEFSVSEQSGRVVIAVIDSQTNEVVRQIPPDALLRYVDGTAPLRGLLFEAAG